MLSAQTYDAAPIRVLLAESASVSILATVLEPVLIAAALRASPASRPTMVSFALERAGAASMDATHGVEAEAFAAVERATRTLAFVAGEVRALDGRLIAAASAVFSLSPKA